VALGAGAARAEDAWVKEEVRLNLRAGPGTEFRILEALKTGDAVQLVERTQGWTRVRYGDQDGWVPEGYLQTTPPAVVKLAQVEAEAVALREQLSALGAEAAGLRQGQADLAAREAKQADELERLRRENAAFRTGARWPEWFAGSALLSVGMLLGALVRSVGPRPRVRRVRL
jgi:SH3 domain protein